MRSGEWVGLRFLSTMTNPKMKVYSIRYTVCNNCIMCWTKIQHIFHQLYPPSIKQWPRIFSNDTKPYVYTPLVLTLNNVKVIARSLWSSSAHFWYSLGCDLWMQLFSKMKSLGKGLTGQQLLLCPVTNYIQFLKAFTCSSWCNDMW